METKKPERVITPEIPISTVSTTQADYGSTTETRSAPFSHTKQYGSDIDQHQRVGESHTGIDCGLDHITTGPHKKRGVTKTDSGFTYQNLDDSRNSSQVNTDSRISSFVSIPESATGRFRFHPMEGNNKHMNNRVNNLKTLEYSLNVLSHVLIGFTTLYLSWLFLRTGLAGTALHAWLVTIGYGFLMAEGIMCYYPGNVLTFTYNRDTKTTIHWILQAVGGGLGILGTLIKLIQKDFLLTSTHGKLGFASLFLCIFSMLSGLSALYSMRLKRLLTPLLTKTVHNWIGFITFFMASLTQFYGYNTGYFTRNAESELRVLMKCLTLISLALVSIGPLKALLKKTEMVYSQHMS